MTKTVVVPLDGSGGAERAALLGAELSRAFDATLVLTTVASLADSAHHYLEEAAERLHATSARLRVVKAEDVPEAIIRVVSEEPEPLLCIATHARGRVGATMLGSVAEELVRQARCPVLLVGPHCSVAWPSAQPRMLVCLDESEISSAVLEPAVDWAKALDFEVVLAEVFHPLDVQHDDAREHFLASVAERLRQEGVRARRCTVPSGYVPGAVVHLAADNAVSLIAMGSHGRTGLGRLALGSIMNAVLHEATCPVLTIRSSASG
jgi:nucleotide-binding universal stress UspA family protein